MSGPATLVVDNVPSAMSAILVPAATTDAQNRPGYWGWTVGFYAAPPGACDGIVGGKGELEVVTSMFSTSASDVTIPVGTISITRNLPVPITSPVAIVWAAGDVTVNLDAGSATISAFTSESMDGNFSGTGTDATTNAIVPVTGTFSARRCE